jgi:hypothetical protein
MHFPVRTHKTIRREFQIIRSVAKSEIQVPVTAQLYDKHITVDPFLTNFIVVFWLTSLVHRWHGNSIVLRYFGNQLRNVNAEEHDQVILTATKSSNVIFYPPFHWHHLRSLFIAVDPILHSFLPHYWSLIFFSLAVQHLQHVLHLQSSSPLRPHSTLI